MEYNFSSISTDAIVNFEKKLKRIKEDVMDDISNFIEVLNDKNVIERSSELRIEMSDIFNDTINKCTNNFTGGMNHIQVLLNKYL